MSHQRIALAIVATGFVAAACAAPQPGASPMTSGSSPTATMGSRIVLPSPRTDGGMSLEAALAGRRSVREFASEPLSRAEIGQLLWAAQGVTDAEGHRTAPSAGALYPLEAYAVTAEGVFHYLPDDHALERVRPGDARPALEAASLGQASVGEAPLVIVLAAVPGRTEPRYGARAMRYVQLEAGHAAQNVLLQAVALGLGGVPIGAFDDAAVARVVGLASDEVPLYLLPVGHPR